MNTLGARIKNARENIGMSQSELATAIGIKPSSGVISNWERDLNKPDAEKIVKLCDVLDISASFLLDYYGKSTFEAKPSEQNMIEKYRSLDPHGKDMVDIVLEKEIERMTELEKESISTVIDIQPHLEVNAAHARTDIEPSDEDQAHDDAIMNDDNEWK